MQIWKHPKYVQKYWFSGMGVILFWSFMFVALSNVRNVKKSCHMIRPCSRINRQYWTGIKNRRSWFKVKIFSYVFLATLHDIYKTVFICVLTAVGCTLKGTGELTLGLKWSTSKSLCRLGSERELSECMSILMPLESLCSCKAHARGGIWESWWHGVREVAKSVESLQQFT